MEDKIELKQGDRVTYKTDYKTEKGIVKRPTDSGAFVVYNCGDDWANYQNYTAASTNRRDLILGWPEDNPVNGIVDQIFGGAKFSKG